jgi:hypothetical protein
VTSSSPSSSLRAERTTPATSTVTSVRGASRVRNRCQPGSARRVSGCAVGGASSTRPSTRTRPPLP